MSVFDAACAPVYLRDKTDVAFRPFGLDIFDRLADLCGEVRKRLESEKTKLSALAPNLPMLPEGTKAKALVDGLTALTNADDVRSLATLSSMEHKRLDQLRAHQGDLLAANPKQRAKELTARAERIELLARHIAGLFSTFRGSSLDRLRSTTETLRIAQAALAILRKTTLTPDLLLGTGEETWRKMWEAAEAFSEVAYPESSSFPVLKGGARCPFCQQTIGEKAEERLRHFGEYVSSAAQAQVREAESAQKAALATVTDAVIARPEIDLAITELNSESPPLAKDVQDFLKAAGRIQKGIGEALAQGIWFLTNGVTRSPEADLRTSATSLRERAKQLLVAKPAMTLQDAGELSELEARTTFSKQLQLILNEIERKSQLAAYDQCIRDAATQAITRKSTEFTTRLVTEQLQTGFRDELERLEFNHLAVEIQAAGGRKGELFHRLAFTNAPGIAVTHVLSEGESRTLSLASFLTELRTATNRDAIIFDDPVSSLDELWRERIARRLVSEAGERQVIVFTHDLLFLRFLIGAAKGQEVPCAHQYVRREDEIGLCSADLPWIAMSTNDRIARLRNRWQSAEKTFRTARGSYEVDGRDIYGLLREAWERATTEVLLNDVVERYRHSIETQKVRLLHDITEDDYKTLEAGMAECSRWARGHDRPAADGTPFPEPEALKKRIDDLEGWVKAIRRRRKR